MIVRAYGFLGAWWEMTGQLKSMGHHIPDPMQWGCGGRNEISSPDWATIDDLWIADCFQQSVKCFPCILRKAKMTLVLEERQNIAAFYSVLFCLSGTSWFRCTIRTSISSTDSEKCVARKFLGAPADLLM